MKKYFAIHKPNFAKQCGIILREGNVSISLQLMYTALVNQNKLKAYAEIKF